MRFADGSHVHGAARLYRPADRSRVRRAISPAALVSGRAFTSIADASAGRGRAPAAGRNVRINDVFYRGEPHMMRRYLALALDNIGRDPIAFVAASAYRMIRLFIIRGTDDRSRAQQFAAAGSSTAPARSCRPAYFLLFARRRVIAWRRRSARCCCWCRSSTCRSRSAWCSRTCATPLRCSR